MPGAPVHPADTLADRVADAMRRWLGELDDGDLDAFGRTVNRLRDIAARNVRERA